MRACVRVRNKQVSRLRSNFLTLCKRFAVMENDLLVLEALEITTAEQFYYRVPTAERLEAYISERVWPASATHQSALDVCNLPPAAVPPALCHRLAVTVPHRVT